MKKIWIVLLLLISMAGGIYLEQRFQLIALLSGTTAGDMETAVEETAHGTEREILYWVAPMDPNFRRDKPGKSPMGMDLIPVYEENGKGAEAGVVRIAPEVINNLGVRTARAEQGELSRRIDTVAYINYDETRISHVHLRTEGWIHELTVAAEEERVKKGQLLFTLYSPTLVNAQEEYLRAAASGNQPLLQASGERLLALGLTRAQIDNLQKTGKPAQHVATYASQSGVVAALNVRHGMYVKPETEIMSLASLDTIWIEAEVFERQANWVKTGQPVEARISALTGRVWKGNVDYVYPELDPITRTLRVRLRFENPEEFLKPNMYADVSILSEVPGPVIHIPREALIDDGKVPRVILALGEGRFKARAVTPGIESGNRVEIIEGLDEGEVVVTSAQFLIDSEASLGASFQRMSPSGEQKNNKTHDHPMGTGVVNDIDEEKRIINLSHEAIPELNWPAMTMDFTVAGHLDLSAIELNRRIKFWLTQDETDAYFITNIAPVEAEGNGHD